MGNDILSVAGVFPPITTPFDENGDVDYGALQANVYLWNGYDLAGYVVLGSNGEAAYLKPEEKVNALRVVRTVIPPDKLLVAGTGCESTRETVEVTRAAAEQGADAALVLTPHYFAGKMTGGALVRHFETVADESPIPILLYNVPKFTNVDMDATTIARAGRHPNIIGVKDSGGDITKLGDIVRLADPDFQVLVGSAGFFFAGLTLGAVGGVLALANIAPQQCIDIYNLFRRGQWDDAAELQRRMIPVNAAVTARFGIAGLKAAMDLLGFRGGPVRRPLLDLSDDDRQTLRAVLAEGGLL